jgi:hypothetical protein
MTTTVVARLKELREQRESLRISRRGVIIHIHRGADDAETMRNMADEIHNLEAKISMLIQAAELVKRDRPFSVLRHAPQRSANWGY